MGHEYLLTSLPCHLIKSWYCSKDQNTLRKLILTFHERYKQIYVLTKL